jgi:hypothetical protein
MSVHDLHPLLLRLHRHEQGTTLTEFVITLPVFLVVFVGLLQLGTMENSASKVWGEAYRDTWTQTLTVLDSDASLINIAGSRPYHLNPSLAGAMSLAQLANHPPRNEHRLIQANVLLAEGDVYRNMAGSGHWGEASSRIGPTGQHVRMRHLDQRTSWTAQDVLGESRLGHGLFNDGPAGAPIIGGGTSPTLGNLPFAGRATRPVIGAGMRYGAVMGKAERVETALGWTVHLGTEYTVLVPPVPVPRAQITMAVTRQALEDHRPYRELLGIADQQPLRREAAAGGFSFGDD